MIHWAIDFGTSNTTVCHDLEGQPRVVHLGDLTKLEPLTQTPVTPSTVCILDPQGHDVLIGQKAISFNWDGQSAGFARGFKRLLETEGTRPVAKVQGTPFSAYDVTGYFFRELLRAIEAQFREEVTDLTISVPTDFFETYRSQIRSAIRRHRPLSWWRRLLSRLKLARPGMHIRFLDEPVAAALGYGVNLDADKNIVAVDFGAGTMEIAVIRSVAGQTPTSGRANVLAKHALRLGGDNVDQWIVERFASQRLQTLPEWRVALAWEAERVKLLASAGREGEFKFQNRVYGKLDYDGLVEILEENGVYDKLRDLATRVLEELEHRQGLKIDDVDEVLLEGGSTLLPELRATVGEIFGLHKVREWFPFQSVARGACTFARGVQIDDFIYHDYALRILDGTSVAYELLIPRGSRYPTAEDFVTRYYAPGHDGQQELSLFICEVGRIAGRPVNWRGQADGSKRFAPGNGEDEAFCICLNEQSAPLPLRPAGRGTAPRLRVTYSVDAERWLCVTVHDLLQKTDLKVHQPVVRLR